MAGKIPLKIPTPKIDITDKIIANQSIVHSNCNFETNRKHLEKYYCLFISG